MSGPSALSAPTAMSASRPRRRTGPARKPTSRTWRGRTADLLELGVVEVLRPIAQQKTRACAGARRAVIGVVEGASVERQTSAADAAVQQIASLVQHLDPGLERAPDAPTDRLPILPRGLAATSPARLRVPRASARVAARSAQRKDAGCPRA